MIFLTVGTQMPFDRLVKWMDKCVIELKLQRSDVYAQIADSDYMPKNFNHTKFLSEDEFETKLNDADIVVSHAGMGTIINTVLGNKKCVIVPRLSLLDEHRNDHQIDTCEQVADISNVVVASTYDEFISAIESLNDKTPENNTTHTKTDINESSLGKFITNFLKK